MEGQKKKYTWDLSHMYKDIKDWYMDVEEAKKLSQKIISQKGIVTNSAKNLLTTLTLNDELSIKLTSLYVYAKMYFDQDMSNAQAKELFEIIDALHTKIQDQLAFLEPELLQIDVKTLEKYVKIQPELSTYNHMFEKLFQRKEHIFTAEIEEILTKMNSLGGSFEKVYDDMTVNDIEYPEVIGSNENDIIIANNSNYYKALNNQDRTLRKNYFQGLLGTYGKYINTITSSYYGSVKHDVFLAKTRKYKSSRQMALQENFIPEEVYDNLITTVRENVKTLHEYLDFRKKVLNLDEIHFYDLFVPIVKDIDKTYTYEEAQQLVLEATSVLGSDYTDILKEAFNHNWIDVYPAKNKVSGAYAIQAYGYHPYSLLNFTGTLGDVFTIAHELGHVMHSYYSSKTQPYINSDYTIFTAEVASTVNEQLLYNYLLNKSSSPEQKALLLSNHLDNIRSTLYRQTLFADFESQAHQMVEEEKPLLPEVLCNLHQELYEIYHGPEFVIDPELKYEWARIPHFYRSFYVYQYATGVSAAISITSKIFNEGNAAVKKYREFLTKGGSDYSINLLKIAGVDMRSPAPILDAINNFKITLEELKNIIRPA
ncbi:MAG: oligoendopeptidase [Clostridia bacterium]|jgi:oligoendopeptidase F|nr:oligoendopeptidase [Clostridia bacterium]MDN5321935.1 oligoendopeptidase [Clostridia bacterium]